jgi:hypothetical protein
MAPLTKSDDVPQRSEPDTSISIHTELAVQRDFPLFSKLPKELRLKIWTMACEEKRVVAIAISRPASIITSTLPASKASICTRSRGLGELTSSTPPPSVLYTCVESREVGLEKYTLAFGCRSGGWWSSQRYPGRIPFNFEHDILYLQRNGTRTDSWDYVGIAPLSSRTTLFKPLDPNDVKRVQFLGFDLGLKSYVTSLNWQNIEQWSSLKCLYLGIQEPRLDPNKAVKFIPLIEKRCGAFVQAFRSRFYSFSASIADDPFPRSIAARVKWIKAHCIHGSCPPEQQIRCEEVKRTEVRLVSVVNS